MTESAVQFWCDEKGVTAVEYGLVGALIAMIIVGAMAASGTTLKTFWERIADCLLVPTGPTC